MTFSFQPQIIKTDSAVPFRMIAGGWASAVFGVIVDGPVRNPLIALMGLTLVAGGLIAVSTWGNRMWTMLIGAAGGGATSWFGYQYALHDRIFPARDDPTTLLDRPHLAALAVGLGVLSIGIGGMLEAVRAQTKPGTSPFAIRLVLIGVGMAITGSICALAGVAPLPSIVSMLATASILAAMSWLRRERPASAYIPTP